MGRKCNKSFRTHQIFQSERHFYFQPIWELTGFNSLAQRPDKLTMFFRTLLQSIQINAGIMTHCNIRPISVKHIFNSFIPNFSKFLARDTNRLIKYTNKNKRGICARKSGSGRGLLQRIQFPSLSIITLMLHTNSLATDAVCSTYRQRLYTTKIQCSASYLRIKN